MKLPKVDYLFRIIYIKSFVLTLTYCYRVILVEKKMRNIYS